jgi:hypothetical protein
MFNVVYTFSYKLLGFNYIIIIIMVSMWPSKCVCVRISHSDRFDHRGRVCVPVTRCGRGQDSESCQLQPPSGVRWESAGKWRKSARINQLFPWERRIKDPIKHPGWETLDLFLLFKTRLVTARPLSVSLSVVSASLHSSRRYQKEYLKDN